MYDWSANFKIMSTFELCIYFRLIAHLNYKNVIWYYQKFNTLFNNGCFFDNDVPHSPSRDLYNKLYQRNSLSNIHSDLMWHTFACASLQKKWCNFHLCEAFTWPNEWWIVHELQHWIQSALDSATHKTATSRQIHISFKFNSIQLNFILIK